MMRVALIAALVGASGCGGAAEEAPTRPMSALEHEQAARALEREAASHDAAQRTQATRRIEDRYRCIDQPLVGVPYSGGQPLEVRRPCWTVDPVRDDAAEAEAHRKDAARHRAAAATLVAIERAECSNLGEDEISHSPFVHRTDLIAAEPVRRRGEIVGARVLFRRVPGLDAAWLGKATACHHARAAVMGFSPTFQAYDPLAVPGTSIVVADAEGGIAVTIKARTPTAAAIVWGRVQALIAGDVAPAAPEPSR